MCIRDSISTSHTAFVTSRSAFWSKLAKPAVRSVTDWNRLASTFPPAVSPPIVPGLFHSSSAITAAPPSVSPVSYTHLIAEVTLPEAWVGKTIRELNIRAKYGVNIIAVRENGKINVVPDADLSLLHIAYQG